MNVKEIKQNIEDEAVAKSRGLVVAPTTWGASKAATAFWLREVALQLALISEKLDDIDVTLRQTSGG